MKHDSIHHANRACRLTAVRPQAFTLIELLVVIVIIALLLTIVVGGIGVARRTMSAQAAKAFMGQLQFGLTAFSNDHDKQYPPSDFTAITTGPSTVVFGLPQATFAGWNGGEILVQALIGPREDDNKKGYGFQRAPGANIKTYGPYMEIRNENTLAVRSGTTPNARYTFTMYNARSNPKPAFLYYAANNAGGTSSTFTANDSILGPAGRFNTIHNQELVDDASNDGKVVRKQLEGLDSAKQNAMAVELRAARYLLVYPGPSEEYGDGDDLFVTGQ